jgi:hypothetical protein
MRNTVFDYISNLDTLIAVTIGAFLATGGALVADIIQTRSNRKRNEREAARFFGDILITIDQVLAFAFRSLSIGERWGAVSVRFFKIAYRETSIYERNRERLFDIHDMKLRSRIHTHFLTEIIPLEALIEQSEQIKVLEQQLAGTAKLSAAQTKRMKKEIEELNAARDGGAKLLSIERDTTIEICRDLEKIAGIKFEVRLDPSEAVPRSVVEAAASMK